MQHRVNQSGIGTCLTHHHKWYPLKLVVPDTFGHYSPLVQAHSLRSHQDCLGLTSLSIRIHHIYLFIKKSICLCDLIVQNINYVKYFVHNILKQNTYRYIDNTFRMMEGISCAILEPLLHLGIGKDCC